MTATDTLLGDWATWHADREATLATPHGWLSLTALHWLTCEPQSFPDLPGTWRVAGDGVEVSGDGLALDGAPVSRVEPVDGLPGVLVEAEDRRIEVVRRTDAFALRVRDPQAPTRAAFTGVPAFPVDGRWVVEGRFTPYDAPRRLTVGAVVEGLQHFPTAVGTVTFPVDGREQTLVALAGKDGGPALHFHDATSGRSTYGGGRILQAGVPDADGRLVVDLNRTVNLPCALTAFATCPLPPEGNRLAVAVEAGERS